MPGMRLLVAIAAIIAAPMIVLAFRQTIPLPRVIACYLRPNSKIKIVPSCGTTPVKSGETPYVLGLASLDRGDFDRAISEFSAAIELDPTDVFPYLKRANAYEKKGDRESALADYRKAATVSHDAELLKSINTAIGRLASKR
jgi:tetratricopeptide (TPR) repeat protein